MKLRHDSKLANLINEKRIQDGIHNNPNEIIINLTDTTLSNYETEILKYGLTHGNAIRPKKSEMIMIMENIYDQIMRYNIVKDSYISTECLKTTLKVFTFNYLDIDDRRYFHDNKRLNALRELRNKFATLKPHIGQGIVLINHDDYINLLRKISDDSTKFKKLTKDLTITRLTTVQNYLNTLFIRGEINESDKKAIRPKLAQIVRAHGRKPINVMNVYQNLDLLSTQKIHLTITYLSFLSNLLHPLTENEYIVQDSFCAFKKIRKIPKELFEDGYRFVSFDAVSLFTNIPLSKTISNILDRIYNQNLLRTNI